MQRAISPAMAPSSASGDSSAPGVSMMVTSGRPSSSARRMPRRASRRAAAPSGFSGVWRTRSWPDEHARLSVEPGQRDEHGGVLLALLGAVQREGPGRAVPQHVAYAEPRLRPGQLHRLPDRPARPGLVGPHGQHRLGRRVDQHGQGLVDQHRQVLGRHDRVDDALLGEVLGPLDPVGERLALERLVDLRAEEPDQRSRLGDGHVPERPPRRVDAAGRRVAQVHEVGQPGRAVRHHGAGDRDHLDEGRSALLHPGAARGSGGEQRQTLGRGASYARHDALARGDADRAAEEGELVDHERHRATAHQPAPGDHGLVGAGTSRRRLAARPGSRRSDR